MAIETRDHAQAAAAAIQEANRKFMDAFERRDTAALARFYGDDALVMPPHSEAVRGRDSIGEFWQGMFDIATSVTLETIDVMAAGDAVVEAGRYRVMAGESVADRGKYLVVWKQEGGQWKLHRDIWNTSQPPAQGA